MDQPELPDLHLKEDDKYWHEIESNAGEGIIDSLLEVFNLHNHPFIAIGNEAMKWMGSRNMLWVAFDILVKSEQMKALADHAVATGDWEYSDPPTHGPTDPRRVPEGETFLRAVRVRHHIYTHARLCPEHLYKLEVDGLSKIEVPDMMAWNPAVIETYFHPDPINFTYGPDVWLPSDGERNDPPVIAPDRFKARRKSRIPIFIPSMPSLIVSLIDRQKPFAETWRKTHSDVFLGGANDINLLTRYLYLELQPQRQKILDALPERIRPEMEAELTKFKRKPLFGIDLTTKKTVEIFPWKNTTPRVRKLRPEHSGEVADGQSKQTAP